MFFNQTLGGIVAEGNAAEKQTPAEGEQASTGKKSNLILIGLVLINMVVVVGVGYMVYTAQKIKEKEVTVDDYVKGAHSDDKAKPTTDELVGHIVKLESFIVNLAESKGTKIFRVNMELEVESAEVQDEVQKRMPQIRDIIIILLSSKNYRQISTPAGKDELKDEIRDTINTFLTRGKVVKVLFTEFLNN